MEIIENQLIQGSDEWLALRKTKITATDAPIIMCESPWKTPRQLYQEKIGEKEPQIKNSYMQRGLDLEPQARGLFILMTGIEMQPKIIVKEWQMASLDGMSHCGQILEIKCAGQRDHKRALDGKIPKYYYGQLQHQMYLCDVECMFYFSFDGHNGVILMVDRDIEYINQMIEKEWEFYQCMLTKNPPEKKGIA